jgi:2'-5' RNA ligase
MRTERLFFALWPDDALRTALVAARDATALAAVKGAAHRPTQPLDLHVTLVFIGPVDAALRGCIEGAADQVALAPFELTFSTLGSWPRQHIWAASPDSTPPPLSQLVEQLQKNLIRCGLQPEARRYRPHVTLARKAPAIVSRPLSLTWQVDGFALARTGTGRTPSYQVLRRWPLCG